VSRRRTIAVIVVATMLVVSAPLWLLDGPGTGRIVGASAQGALGAVTLLCVLLLQPPRTHSASDAVANTVTGHTIHVAGVGTSPPQENAVGGWWTLGSSVMSARVRGSVPDTALVSGSSVLPGGRG